MAWRQASNKHTASLQQRHSKPATSTQQLCNKHTAGQEQPRIGFFSVYLHFVADSHIFAQAAPELVQRIRKGDHGAYELFYRMEFLNLVHFDGSYLQDEERARDIAQETLLAVWENRRKLDPGKNIRSFAFTIARNKTLNELRRRKLFQPTGLEDGALELLEDRSVEQQIEGLELAALIEKVWNKLPKDIAGTFALSREEGLKNREIAAREGISEKTVEYRMRVALGRFRELFRQFV